MSSTGRYTVITDGACSANGTERARGGWAAIVVDPAGEETVLTGGASMTTNNRMELIAAIEGIAATPDGAAVELITDSSYISKAITDGWLESWQRRGWKTANRSPVKNRDLWERMITELERHGRVSPTLVKGHAGHPANERADALAQQAATEDWPVEQAPGEERQLGFDLD
jgi:ribonuclease HI